jgi:two-component system response regulator
MNPEKKKLLYVDDDNDDRELLGEMMHNVAPGLKIIFAINGLQALEVLQRHKEASTLPGLIVLDLNMPYLDGRQTFECIKADPQLKHIPLVIFSSGENPADKALFSREGITWFTKPVEFSAMEGIASHMANLCC